MTGSARPTPGPEPDQPGGRTGLIGRFLAVDNRFKLLLIVGLLLVLMFWGPLRSCSGVTVPQDEAIATARAEIDFEPDNIEAKVLRQGVTSAWIVVFTVKDPDGGRDEFLRHTSVRVNASTGELMDVTVHVG